MASTLASSSSSSSNAYVAFLEQAKHDFCMSNAHLSEEDLNRAWFQAACQPSQPSMAHQVPRSMAFNTSNMTQLPTTGFEEMDRTRSAPVMNRSDSAMTDNLHRSNTTYSDWPSMSQESNTDYTLYSDTSMRRQPTLQSMPETAYNSIAEYSVGDYVSSCIQPDNSSSLPTPQHSQQLQLTPSLQWSSSSDASSPSTPSTALMTPVTQSSNMSRQGSYNPLFFDNISMSRNQSNSSCMPILPEDGSFPYSFNVASKPISESADGSHFLNFTGSSSEAFLSSSVPASVHALASSDNDQSCLAEDMRRSTSASSSEGYSSEVSAPSSTNSRQSQREREINAQAASRKIAPKAIDNNDATQSASSNAQMTRIRSEDGSSKTVGVLSKTPYVRPQHPKIKCNFCNERPDGFRGTHELDRHIARAHASRRKGYICVDSSADKKFLANCKHCRNKKVYGAYYNAAAHLRRAHFHPRKRGRKGKNDEKRGGIGGGDHPPMEYLKQNWIKEVEVDNKPTPQSPESASDNDASEQIDNTFDTSAYEVDNTAVPAAAYPPSQQPLPMAMPMQVPMMDQVPIDPNQYMDYGMNMHANEPMVFDNNTFFDPNLPVPTDMSNFQFDAYMGP
ncbi:hypothetical protein J4E90_004245 [Alternaria incomplexa]|uniref:uncharacterized protein n=1 Tax=Alternaria incomplexa TaxID=1187928 RepID=UPI002220945B|nr:uncharacterized protein J4E90_004245 [Alternaria incomplexa]KAI4915799.1 hypothetical protein J4E90_004245 [Alternaria incomplexa]